jgi:hypothetical protein
MSEVPLHMAGWEGDSAPDSVGLTNCSKVDMLGSRYNGVNFWRVWQRGRAMAFLEERAGRWSLRGCRSKARQVRK